MNHDRDMFCDILVRVIEGGSSAEDREMFRTLMKKHPSFMELYREQQRMHNLLQRFSGQSDAECADMGCGDDAATAPPAAVRHRWRKRFAAAAAALALGTGLWLESARSPVTAVYRPPLPLAVVRDGVAGLELPSSLPGMVRLIAGEAAVRLSSGVELTLLGPVELEVRDAMQVQLVSGRLLSDVPRHASGFKVLTSALELRDLGTVFGVTVSGGVSDVFVFQGSVQVNEASGDPVDLCTAGEGVRAVPGQRPRKVVADWPEARRLFENVEGRRKALQNPSASFAAADRIALLCTGRDQPVVVPPMPGLWGSRPSAMDNQPRGAAGVPDTLAAERSQTSVRAKETSSGKQEETEMKAITAVAAVTAAAVLGTAGAAQAVPEVTNVRMQQRANTRIVDVWYDLAGEAAIVTLGIETNGMQIPDSAVTRVSGDVSRVVQPGSNRSMVWNAGEDWPEHVVTDAKACVTAWSTNAPPQVMVIDLGKGTAATEADPYPVYYYTSLEALPNGGLSNNLYKTDCLVMRKIPSGGYAMGDESVSGASVPVTLTRAFYAGVYEVTQKQWYKVMGTDPSSFKNVARPVEMVGYHQIRENFSSNTALSPNWPQSDAVGADSFMGLIRSRCGIFGFDLPTVAQAEYYCRAGTTTYYHDGVTLTNAALQLAVLGWYIGNSGGSTHEVGLKAPNAWGLYDTHGNVWEWCLDWHGVQVGGIDPKGPETPTLSSRRRRGGGYEGEVEGCRSAVVYRDLPTATKSSLGFRLVRNLP